MARKIDLGPLPELNPDKIGEVQLRADPRRRRVVSNPPGAFVELKQGAIMPAGFRGDTRVTLRAVEVNERDRDRIMHSVGLYRGGHFMGLRCRRDVSRAVCYAVYLALMLGHDRVYLDGQGMCVSADAGAAWIVNAGEGVMHDLRLPADVLAPVPGWSGEDGWQAFNMRDHEAMLSRGPEAVYADFRELCGVGEL